MAGYWQRVVNYQQNYINNRLGKNWATEGTASEELKQETCFFGTMFAMVRALFG